MFQKKQHAVSNTVDKSNKNRELTIRYSYVETLVISTAVQENYKNESLIRVGSRENGGKEIGTINIDNSFKGL